MLNNLRKRVLLPLVAAIIFVPAVASLTGGQNDPNDCASRTEAENETTLRAKSWDPVVTMGRTIADRYQIKLSVEAPRWAFPNDTEDVAVADPTFSAEHNNIHYLVMKRHAIEVRFATSENGQPADVVRLLQQVSAAANKEMPYGYRLDVNGNTYALVPTTTRNPKGELEDAPPLLDRKVTIPQGRRTFIEHGNLMAKELSKQTGLDVSCCQSSVAGIPWGMAEVDFGADNKPAREILRWLIDTEEQANSQASGRHPSYDHWLVRCDGTGAPSCSITVQATSWPSCRN